MPILEPSAPIKTTFCSDCDHPLPETRKRAPHQWLCGKFPRLEGQGFVSPKLWAELEPFMKCVNINGGCCPMFEPMRVNPKLQQLPKVEEK